jgi:hypothetical protein
LGKEAQVKIHTPSNGVIRCGRRIRKDSGGSAYLCGLNRTDFHPSSIVASLWTVLTGSFVKPLEYYRDYRAASHSTSVHTQTSDGRDWLHDYGSERRFKFAGGRTRSE